MSTDEDDVAELGCEAIANVENPIAQGQVLELTDRDMDALLAAIASPPAPNAAMLRSVERWRKCGMPA